jgi:hypothetical protein
MTLAAVMLTFEADDCLARPRARESIPYPKWMVLQLDTAEDPRSRIPPAQLFRRSRGDRSLQWPA